jgi:hypothetical protein
LGREINFEAIGSPTQAKVYGAPGKRVFVVKILTRITAIVSQSWFDVNFYIVTVNI